MFFILRLTLCCVYFTHIMYSGISPAKTILWQHTSTLLYNKTCMCTIKNLFERCVELCCQRIFIAWQLLYRYTWCMWSILQNIKVLIHEATLLPKTVASNNVVWKFISNVLPIAGNNGVDTLHAIWTNICTYVPFAHSEMTCISQCKWEAFALATFFATMLWKRWWRWRNWCVWTR